MWETWVPSLHQEDPLDMEMAAHSSTFAWKIPWTEEPGGLQSMGSRRVGHDWATPPPPPPSIMEQCNTGKGGGVPLQHCRQELLMTWPIWGQCVLSRFSHVRLFSTLWTVAHQASRSIGFSRQEYRSGLPCPPPGDLPDPGIEPTSPALASGFFTAEPQGKPLWRQ